MKVKAVALKSREKFIKTKFGEESYQKFLQKLNPEDKEILESTTLVSDWIPYHTYINVNQKICEEFFGHQEKAFSQFGEASAEEALTTIYKTFVATKNVKRFIQSAPDLYSLYYQNLGNIVVHFEGENVVNAKIIGNPEPHRSMCLSIIGYFQKGLQMCGAKNIIIQEKKCACWGDDCCEIYARWET